MKRLLIICCLAIFLAGCAKMEKPQKNVPAQPVAIASPDGMAVPHQPVAGAPQSGPFSQRPSRGTLNIGVYAGPADRPELFRWAEIYLDGAFISKTSTIRLYLDPGTHTIDIKAKGFKPSRWPIMILPSAAIQSIEVLLEPE